MFDWLLGASKDLPVWGQVLLDVVKVLLGFVTILVVTRWTLSRADRKDIIARQAKALDEYSATRIAALNKATAGLSKMIVQLNKIHGAYESDLEQFDKGDLIANHFNKIEEFVDEIVLALNEYDDTPGSIPNDYDDVAEAFVVWLTDFYNLKEGILSLQSLTLMVGMCSTLSTQLKWLTRYELNMRLQVALNPASAWSADFGNFLESATMEFLSKEGLARSSEPQRIVATIIECASKNKKMKQPVIVPADLTPLLAHDEDEGDR